MNKLEIDELHKLRLLIFDNAESLYKEAKLLYNNNFYARAYLLAHLAYEELGKIPIIVGAIGQTLQGKEINWKKIKKRFLLHKEKVKSEDYHYYMFGLDLDLLRNSDLKWLNDQSDKTHLKVNKKNESTYVDVIEGNLIFPSHQISPEDANQLIELTFNCLKAHWRSESLTNPIIVKTNKTNINTNVPPDD